MSLMKMSAEWIQTIVLTITGAFVIWYTIETYKLRKEMAEQNELIANQLKKISEQLLMQKKDLALKVKPLFRFGAQIGGIKSVDIFLKNEGQDIKNVEIVPIEDYHLKAEISGGILKRGEEIKIQIPKIPQDQRYLHFKILYETLLNDKHEVIVRYDKSNGEVRQLNTDV